MPEEEAFKTSNEALKAEIMRLHAQAMVKMAEWDEEMRRMKEILGMVDDAAGVIPVEMPYRTNGNTVFECKARKQSLPEPAECDWPQCGCDPYANRVLEALQEQGLALIFESVYDTLKGLCAEYHVNFSNADCVAMLADRIKQYTVQTVRAGSGISETTDYLKRISEQLEMFMQAMTQAQTKEAKNMPSERFRQLCVQYGINPDSEEAAERLVGAVQLDTLRAVRKPTKTQEP